MTFLDTNIVIDVLGTAEGMAANWSRNQYAQSVARGAVACNHVILAEVAAGAGSPDRLTDDLDRFQIELLPFSNEAALSAGSAFATYRRRGGRREIILPDFLIAGHADALRATLVTRDRRLASYFPDLSLITPETHPHG